MYSNTPDIISFPKKSSNQLLTDEQCLTLRNGTLQLLDEAGVHIPSQRALDIFEDHGARVDRQKQIVRIPPDLVQNAMKTAPGAFTLGGREERFDLKLDGKQTYICTAGTAVHVIDPKTRIQRPSCKQDLATFTRICDALPMVSFMWSSVTSQDFGTTASLHDCHAMLTNTLKHVRGGTSVTPKVARSIVEMASIVSNNAAQFRARPPINANICTISPLAHDSNGIESALIYAEAGIPVSFMAMPIMGATVPYTPFGALVTGDAEVVSGLVLLQLAYPGTPVFYSVLVTNMNPVTGKYIAKFPLPSNIMAMALGRSWGVPCLGGARMGSDAREVGWQSGMESALGASVLPWGGGDIGGHVGLLGGAMILYPEQIILDHEVCQSIYDLYYRIDFEEDLMALDIIKEVGPRNEFLTHRHTLERIRDYRISPILYPHDSNGTSAAVTEAALQEYNRIDQEHRPAPLSEKVQAELNQVLGAADRQLAKVA